MKYRPIFDGNRTHLLKLIDLLYQEVRSAGGDGDALWYSRYYGIKDILSLIEEYNNSLEHKWNIDFREEEGSIYWWNDQESVLITNDEEIYNNMPSWQQFLVVN